MHKEKWEDLLQSGKSPKSEKSGLRSPLPPVVQFCNLQFPHLNDVAMIMPTRLVTKIK